MLLEKGVRNMEKRKDGRCPVNLDGNLLFQYKFMALNLGLSLAVLLVSKLVWSDMKIAITAF